MLLTVADALQKIYPFVDGHGVCLTDPQGYARALQIYNDICEELMTDDAWDGATAEIEMEVCDQCFSLPSEFETVRACTLNGNPSPIRPSGWRYLQQGPETWEGCSLDGVIDLGDHFATARDLPRPLPLTAYSDAPETGNVTMHLQGTHADDSVIWSNEAGVVAQRGEVIAIRPAAFQPIDGEQVASVRTRHVFARRPSLVTKSVTRGFVYLAGYDPATMDTHWLATYGPDETRPSYRRYRLKQNPNYPASVVARVDVRFVPAVHGNQRAMIQHGPAYEIYTQALAARRASQFDDYQRFRNSALAKLNQQKGKKSETATHMPSISPVRSGARLAFARRV